MKKDITTIHPAPHNPRIHSDAQIAELAKSIEQFGFTQPIVIDENNNILAGHGRYAAAQKLGLKEVPCAVVKGPAVHTLRYMIADNKLYEMGAWDNDNLNAILAQINSLDEGTSIPGLLDDSTTLPEEEAPTDKDTAPDLFDNIETSIKHGDVIKLGDHIIVCGDSTKKETYDLLLGCEATRMMITDPPYNVGYRGTSTKKRKSIENDKMSDDGFRDFIDAFFGNAVAVCDGGMYIFFPDSQMHNLIPIALSHHVIMRAMIVWVKSRMSLGWGDYHQRHEPCFYGWKEGAPAKYFTADRTQTTVWEFPKPASSKLHPTMKPVALFEQAIINSSEPNDLVLDPFSGSGTTIIACENLGRRARVIELTPQYVEIACRRWEEHTGGTREFIETK